MGTTFNIYNILSLIGGLALFLYGMDIMGSGLRSLAEVSSNVFLKDLRQVL